MRKLGPNHRDGCDGSDWRYSGDGYNRVRVCACGAEDYAPTPESWRELRERAKVLLDVIIPMDTSVYVVKVRKDRRRKRRARYNRGRTGIRPRKRCGR